MDYEERNAIRNRRVALSVGFPISLLEVMDRISAAEGVPLSHLVERLVRKGLEIERNERAAKVAVTTGR